MFGSGKKKNVEGKPSVASKASKDPFNFKQFMLKHCEKMVLGLFVAATSYLVYDGVSGTAFEKTKTPDDLLQKTTRTRRDIVEVSHWDAIKNERIVQARFAQKSELSRQPTSSDPYTIGRLDNKDLLTGGKRGDPDLLPPIDLKVQSFYGAIAFAEAKPGAIEDLPNAPAVNEDRRRTKRGSTTTTPIAERKLNAKYDQGFQYVPGGGTSVATTPQPGAKAKPEPKLVPKVVLFNAVTAAVPHEKIADNYKKEFANSAGYQPDRDSPNYLSYEVQRVDVTDDPNREVPEEQWQDAKECWTAAQLKMKDLWPGETKEIADETYIVKDKLTMAIPPVLLSSYQDLASHPLVPRIKLTTGAGYGGGYGGGPPSGGPPAGSGYPTGGSSGYGASYGSTVASAGSYGGAAGTLSVEEQALVTALTPKTIEATEYKLLRFFDFGIKAGKTYRYRVRIALEDPNFPRLDSLQPKTSSMKPEVVARVQQLEDGLKNAMNTNKASAVNGNKATGLNANKVAAIQKVGGRPSRRLSSWSQPSSSSLVKLGTPIYASKVEGSWNSSKLAGSTKGELGIVETVAAKAVLVYGEWNSKLGALVPRKLTVERGSVLAGTAPEGGLDIVNPVSKVIKLLTGFRFTDPVTVVDIRGGTPLAAEKRSGKDKDPLASSGEVVAYDPRSGDLVISREFRDLDNYRMFSYADEVEAAEPEKPAASGAGE